MEKITIICTRDRGVYRGGVFHPPGVTHWDISSFNQSQLDSIKKEPLLIVKEAGTTGSVEDAVKDVVSILRPFVEVTEQVVVETIAELVAKKQDADERDDGSSAGDDEVSSKPILPRTRKRGTSNAQ